MEVTSLTPYSCGDHLLSNEAGLDVFFDANGKGAGIVNVNDVTHFIALEPAESGGFACSRIYGEERALVHCYLPLSSTLEERDIEYIDA
ncbi:hypothetical protein B0T11DRAFT_99011 [Plectosphaerella cucumerina]|uniref:Uncharacterized protein n=1 Tax=Plectosphaerella cucumerina TaxID=40658 RepID=A0A8K0TA15_9PEZI|nr:hypothetical protein B0T11DRAFT_99011 [Plectosphaerella cucumerina]